MRNLGLYQTTVEDMKKAGGPEIWMDLIKKDSWQDGYDNGSKAMLVKLAFPLGVGLFFTGKQLIDIGINHYANVKEKRLLIKKAAVEAEEKLTQLFEEELSEENTENGGK